MAGSAAFGERVRQALHARNRSVRWLALQIGVNPGTFANFISGRRAVSRDVVMRVTDALGERPEPYLVDAGFDPAVGLASLSLLPDTVLAVPLVGRVPADPREEFLDDELVYFVPHSPTADPKNLRALRVVGDCLAPRIPPGAFVIVDVSMQPADGRDGVVRVDGAYTLKQLRRRPGGWALESNTGPVIPLQHAEWFGLVVFVGWYP